MASFTDQIPQFNPYVQQLPVEAMVAVGMEKQKRYDEGYQKIQASIDAIAGLEVASDVDRAYLQSKLNQLGNDLTTVAAGDFSNYQLVNSVDGMAKQLVYDPNIQNALSSTAKLKKEQARKEKAIADGKSSPENEWMFNNQVSGYLGSTKPGESFNGQYIEYRDVDKKLRDLVSKLKEVDKTIENPYQRDNLGRTLYFHRDSSGKEVVTTDSSKGQPKVDTMMLRTTVKGIGAEKILNNFYDSLDEGDKRQLNITAQYHYKDATPITFQNDIIKTYNEKKKLYSDAIVDASVKLATADLTPEQRTKLQNDINQAKELVYDGGLDKEMRETMETVDTEEEATSYKYKIYTQKYLTNLAKDLANESISTEYKDNPGFKSYMDQKRFEFDIQKENRNHQRWLAGHLLEKEKFNYTKLKDAKEEAADATLVTPGAINTNLPKKTLFDLGVEIEKLDEDKTKIDNKYANVLFPDLKGEEKQKALDELYKEYKINPKKSLTPNQREYLKERSIIETNITDKNNLYNSAVTFGKQFETDKNKLFKNEKGLRVGDTSYSSKELYDFYKDVMSRHSYDVGSYGGGGSNLTMGAGSSSKTKQTKIKDDLLETYRNSKFYPIALAIHSGFNKGRGKLTDNQKIIFEKLLNLNSSITPKVYEKDEEILSKQSEYIMKHMPEYQTQVGTVNMSNEDVVSRVDQLLTAKAIQYDERGALDQNRSDDYDPETVAAIRQNKTKTAGYQIVKNYDGSATLVISSGIGKAQRVPVTSSEFMTYFPEYSRRNIVSDIKSAVMASPNKTTNLSGTMDPVNARMDGFTIPGLIGSGLEEKVRYDVIGSPFNDGSDNDKFQVVMYFNSSKGWVTKVVNESEYATEQGVSNIINNIVPYTISTMLK
jgi:hypothetical protein